MANRLFTPLFRRVWTRARLGRGCFGSQVIVLMYHRIASLCCDPWALAVSPENFDEHLNVLKTETEVLSATDFGYALVRNQLPKRAAVLTFDDGYADNVLNGEPLLESHGLPAILFVATGGLDSPREFWWDELERIFLHPGTLPKTLELMIRGAVHQWSLGAASTYSKTEWEGFRAWRAWTPARTIRERIYIDIWQLLRPLSHSIQQAILNCLANWAGMHRIARASHRLMTTREAQGLAQRKRIEIGGHTVSHLAMPDHPRAVQEQEIAECREALATVVGYPVRHFSYPYGSYSDETVEVISQSGFMSAFTTDFGAVRRDSQRWVLPRQQVFDWDKLEFRRQLRAWLWSST